MRGDLRSDSYVLLASCSEYVHECVNRSGVGVNTQMRPEASRTLTRQRESKRGGEPRRDKERELNRESQWCRCECASERGQLNARCVWSQSIRPVYVSRAAKLKDNEKTRKEVRKKVCVCVCVCVCERERERERERKRERETDRLSALVTLPRLLSGVSSAYASARWTYW